jgi:hypothetical protein
MAFMSEPCPHNNVIVREYVQGIHVRVGTAGVLKHEGVNIEGDITKYEVCCRDCPRRWRGRSHLAAPQWARHFLTQLILG